MDPITLSNHPMVRNVMTKNFLVLSLILGETHASSSSSSLIRNIWTCNAHIITGVIGSGVLSLAWSTAQLGWIAGPISMVCFAIVTYVSASLLSDCYRSPDPVTGTRNYTYVDAVNVILGKKQKVLCGFLLYLGMYGTGVAYVVTASISMRYITSVIMAVTIT
ncbi:hypothetical protein MKW94_022627 [Papaver nudicaule]|uniref:Amino acid transporter transmembrane domain-containing protein n=1 Tax=Papaver nudicaule TaxID=74823 RepID=A0AA41V4R0_PAPNU|nr:hypothetical protein [Papaver nudicaule]